MNVHLYSSSIAILSKLLLCFSLFSQHLTAQVNTDRLGAWGMLVTQTRIHSKWSIHAEYQFRSYDPLPNTEQSLLRAGINFHYSPTLTATAGYAYITNHMDDESVFKPAIVEENRIWEQLVLKNTIHSVFIEHRYRFEQRWVHANYKTNYRNRIRYLLRLTIPINRKELKKNTLFVSFYDEIFINMSSMPFDRNRLYGAVGYQFSTSLNVQAGYLLQTVGNATKQYLQLGINYNPDLRKSK